MLTIRAMSDGKGYSSRHLEHSDYYAEGERVVGHWQGRGAELVGLSGEVKPGEFESLRQGLNPETGEFLRQRQSADRVDICTTRGYLENCSVTCQSGVRWQAAIRQ